VSGVSLPQADAVELRRLSFHGSGGSLFRIHIVNVFLTIVTLGVYYFWGKVKVRRYLLHETEFEGDRFAYHGTGKELLIGFLKAVGVPIMLLNSAPTLLGWRMEYQILAIVLIYAITIVFIPVAVVVTRRYRLSRTSWRGIRFSFRGRMVEFIKLFVLGTLLTTITLGLYYPIFATRRYGFLTSYSYFGTQNAEFNGRGRDLFRSYLHSPRPISFCERRGREHRRPVRHSRPRGVLRAELGQPLRDDPSRRAPQRQFGLG